MDIDEIRKRAHDLAGPVSEDRPLGTDVRRSELAIDLKAEVQKLDALAGEAPNWDRVAELGMAVTKTVGKDIVVLSYTSLAFFEQGGIEGALVGLLALEQLVRENWEGIFPPWPRRKTAREKALIWLAKQLASRLTAADTEEYDSNVVTFLVETAEKLNQLSQEKSGAVEPLMSSCVRAAKEFRARVTAIQEKPTQEKPAQEAQEAVTEPTAEKKEKPTDKRRRIESKRVKPPPPTRSERPNPPTPPIQVVAPPKGADEFEKFLRDTVRALIRAANGVRNHDPQDPRSYWLIRFGIWVKSRALPKISKDGSTTIRPLDAGVKSSLEKMTSHKKWREALDLSESSLVDNRYALDLHHNSAKALKQLGPAFEPARRVIESELASLLRRVPGIASASASDGSPLANEETRAWIKRDVVQHAGGGASVQALQPIAVVASQPNGDAFTEARKLLSAGKREVAVRTAHEIADLAYTPRMRFRRRLEVAYICLEAGNRKIAHAMFRLLEKESQQRGLRDWEPQLVTRCLQGLLLTGSGNMNNERTDELYDELCLLDPVAAASIPARKS